MHSGLVSGFIRLDYKPPQITITWNSFFNSTVSSLGTVSSIALVVHLEQFLQ
jgi:hypothetical protein